MPREFTVFFDHDRSAVTQDRRVPIDSLQIPRGLRLNDQHAMR
jgi:hypothetical protein